MPYIPVIRPYKKRLDWRETCHAYNRDLLSVWRRSYALSVCKDKITGGWNSGNYGGCVNIGSGGTFILESGSITGNKIENSSGDAKGGAFFVGVRATLTMSGGSITNNSASAGKSAYGGAVCVHYYGTGNGTFNMNGGTITGNSVSGSDAKGGGVYVGNNEGIYEMNVSGIVTVTGNTANSAANNVDISSGTVIKITGNLDDATRIGITATADQTVTKDLKNYGTLGNFTSDNEASGYVLERLYAGADICDNGTCKRGYRFR